MPSGIYKRSEETKHKMSLAKLGNKYCLGRTYKHSDETKRKLSEMHKGSKSYAWKGGITIDLKKYQKEYGKKWRANNQELKNFYTIKRRCLEKMAEGVYSFEEWENLKKKYDYMCLCCKEFEPKIQLTVDHIIPISRGGSNYITNIQPLCKNCNSKKYTKVIDYVAEENIQKNLLKKSGIDLSN